MSNLKNVSIEDLLNLSRLLHAVGNESEEESPQTAGSHPLLGKNVFIRTVTHHYTGKVEDVTDTEIVLSTASWIAHDGRFHNAMVDGSLDEVEPYHAETLVRVNRGALVDWSAYRHELPTKQK